jgi:ABC-type multidrug transport system fused ATPase/permease subunit
VETQSVAADAPSTGVRRLYEALWTHAEGHRARLLLVIALLVSAQAVRVAIPWLFGEAVNALQSGGLEGVTAASGYLAAMFGAALCAWMMHGPARVMERRTALTARERLADALFGRFVSLPLRFHEKNHSGEVVHRLQKTTEALSGFAQNQFIYLQSAVSIVGPIVALCAVSAVTGGASLVAYTIVAVLLVRFDRVMVRLIREENEAARRYTAALVDAAGNISTVLTLGLGGAVRGVVRGRYADVSKPLSRLIVVNEAKWATIDLLNNLMRTGLVALYGWLAWREAGVILVGTAVMVHQYAQQIGTVVGSLATHWSDLVRQGTDIASADPILAASSAPLERPASDADVGWRELRVEHLTLTHPGAPRPALDDVHLTLRRGGRVALVGDSGSGKSTLLRALAGLYVPDRVKIRVDGVGRPELVDLSAFAMLVPQEPEIFDGDVRSNLTLGVPRSDQDVRRACDLACFTPVLAQLERGLDAVIRERGANLSGGQRQRLALARGLLAAQGAGVVLLDEPTSSIDPVTEARVYDGVLAALGEACVVSAIHRLHLLTRFDTIVLLDGGRVLDSGTFAELLARQPKLDEMWRGYTGHGAAAAALSTDEEAAQAA